MINGRRRSALLPDLLAAILPDRGGGQARPGAMPLTRLNADVRKIRARSMAPPATRAGGSVRGMVAAGADARVRGLQSGLLLGLVLLGGLVASACGGSSASDKTTSTGNGIVHESAQRIVGTALTLMQSATSFAVTGTLSQSGTTIDIDFRLFSNGDASGTITQAGVSAQLVKIGARGYVNAPAAFWNTDGALPADATKLAGRWVVVAAAQLGGVAGFTMASIESTLTPANVGKLTIGGTGTIGSEHVITIVSSTQGTLWVATTGAPYLVALKGGTSSSGGGLIFSNWNQGSPPAVPAGAKSAASIISS